MKKFVFAMTVALICMMLVSCGSAQKKENDPCSEVDASNWDQNAKSEAPVTWEEAKKFCEERGMRLPSKNELQSIRCKNNQSIFEDVDTFWTSEEIGGQGSDMVRTFEFRFGRKEAYSKDEQYLVRCIK
ncbi:DUF1566 domain-containing protein [bacterium]|nr:DUF1566 domain-containing protein [bacterium]